MLQLADDNLIKGRYLENKYIKTHKFVFLIIDNSYNNTHIEQVYPSQNDSISIGTNRINITFVHPRDACHSHFAMTQ